VTADRMPRSQASSCSGGASACSACCGHAAAPPVGPVRALRSQGPRCSGASARGRPTRGLAGCAGRPCESCDRDEARTDQREQDPRARAASRRREKRVPRIHWVSPPRIGSPPRLGVLTPSSRAFQVQSYGNKRKRGADWRPSRFASCLSVSAGRRPA
jgi:hypothetical protein